MKTLYIARHAKSSWDHEGITDFERPLNKRGHKDAPRMGVVLHELGARPGLIRSSAAERAITTARYYAEAFGYPSEEIVVDAGMYGAGPIELIDIVATFPDGVGEAMIVGHNPTMHMLAYRLAGFEAANMPTAAVVCIDFEMKTWGSIRDTRGQVRYFEYPKKNP